MDVQKRADRHFATMNFFSGSALVVSSTVRNTPFVFLYAVSVPWCISLEKHLTYESQGSCDVKPFFVYRANTFVTYLTLLVRSTLSLSLSLSLSLALFYRALVTSLFFLNNRSFIFAFLSLKQGF